MPTIPEGWAVLLSTFIGLIAVYVQHRLGIRNSRITLANAIASEIAVNFDLQIKDMQASRDKITEKARAGTEKFTSWGGRTEHPIYDNVSSDLLLLPTTVLKSIIEFYELDAWVRDLILNMASNTFHELPANKKVEYVTELFNTLEGRYSDAKTKAINQLSQLTQKTRLPW
jgi:hypothetical protein